MTKLRTFAEIQGSSKPESGAARILVASSSGAPPAELCDERQLSVFQPPYAEILECLKVD